MSYAAAIDQLNAMAPELYTQPGHVRRKFSLAEIGALLSALGDPHKRFRSVLIAGTNGKGSTAATLASILRASGLNAGLYTSPHLTRPNERIRINGVEISDDAFAALYFRVQDCGQALVLDHKLDQLPSFFETLTAMAFLHFAQQRPGGASVDLAVLEVGMGGRLDATNIVDPLLSVITDISLDHTEWLGPTISAIAREKAGILRPNGVLVTLPQHPEANQIIGEVATELNVRGVSAVPYMPACFVTGHEFTRADTASRLISALAPDSYPIHVLKSTITVDSPLHGDHQHRNIALAVAAAVELTEHHNLPITPASIEQGIRSTHWPGRLETITTLSPNQNPGAPGLETGVPTDRSSSVGWPETWESDTSSHRSTTWILDVAHNPAGAWALRAALRSTYGLGEPGAPHATLIFGCLRDKPLAEMAHILFPVFDEIIFAPIHSLRATPMSDLLAAAESVGIPARAASSVPEALVLAEDASDRTGRREARSALRVVAGSVYLVGEIRPLLLARTQS